MVPLPPLNLNNDQKLASTSSMDQRGASWGFDSSGWVVNVPVSSGSGLTLQGGASQGLGKWALIAAAAAAFFIFRGKK